MPAGHDKYERRIILDFMSKTGRPSGSARYIYNKWQSKGYTSIDILTFPMLESFSTVGVDAWRILRQLSKTSLIYIMSHGGAGCGYIASEMNSMGKPKFLLPAKKLAEFLATPLAANFYMNAAYPATAKLHVSLANCSAALPSFSKIASDNLDQVNNSFAATLLYELYRKNIYADVAARMGDICYANDGSWRDIIMPGRLPEYQKLLLLYNQAKVNNDVDALLCLREQMLRLAYSRRNPYSKVIYLYKDGKQTMEWAYGSPTWQHQCELLGRPLANNNGCL